MYRWVWYGISVFALLRLIRVLLTKWRGTIDKHNEISVKGKNVIITGPTSGIGQAVAMEMADRDANVILACRDINKAKVTVTHIRSKTSRGQLIVMELDLASLESVRKFAKEFKNKYEKLDILVNNAGLMISPDKRLKTKDGFEMHFGVNHLSHFLLTNLLLEPLKNAAPSRVVTLSSMAHSWGTININDLMSEKTAPKDRFMVSGLYSNSKLANALFNKELGKRLTGTGVHSYSLCPGMVFTNIGKNLNIPFIVHLFRPLFWYLLRSPTEGAATVLYCALSKNIALQTGQMYYNCKFWDPSTRIELTDKASSELWTASAKLVGMK